MLVVLSGEGPSDLGRCDGSVFHPGPMAWMIDKLAEDRLGFSLVDTECIRLISKQELAQTSKGLQPIKLPGKKSKKETGFYFRNARALAKKAREYLMEDSAIIAVLFRDADGTASSGRGEWSDKYQSMINGFRAERFDTGVPMIPKPKSEAWLLCALRRLPYENCGTLEQRSGNDDSPQSLKAELNVLLEGNDSAAAQAELVHTGRVDCFRIGMPSYQAFREALENTLEKVIHAPS